MTERGEYGKRSRANAYGRIGRRLTRHDFDMRRNHNNPAHNPNVSNVSPRLRRRLPQLMEAGD
jgi:hypothetical protein